MLLFLMFAVEQMSNKGSDIIQHFMACWATWQFMSLAIQSQIRCDMKCDTNYEAIMQKYQGKMLPL